MIDWFSLSLAFLIILIFAAIFTLLRTMSSPYIQRFQILVKGELEDIAGTDECYRLRFTHEGRFFELLELKHAVQEDRKTVYNGFVLLKAQTSTDFTLRMDDVLSKVNVASVLEDVLNEKIYDNKAYQINGKSYGGCLKDFRVSTNNDVVAGKFLSNPEVISILDQLKSQFSAYGFLMPLVISKGAVIIDYSLSERLINELVYNPRHILDHVRLVHTLASHVESAAV